MDSHLDHQKSQNCILLNEHMVQITQDKILCITCLQSLSSNLSIEKFIQQQHEIQVLVFQQIDLHCQSFQGLFDQLQKYKEVILQSLDKIAQLILNHLKSTQEFKLKMNSVKDPKSNYKSMINYLQLIPRLQQFNQDAKQQLRNQIQYFKQKEAVFEKIFPFFDDNQIIVEQQQKQNKIKLQEIQIKGGKQFKRFLYEEIKESVVKQDNNCYSFAFNKDNTILLIGYEQEIAVHEFKNERVSKEIQRLNNHTHLVVCLYFMKKTNSFASGSFDNSIIIWNLDKNNSWIAQQILKEHNESVNCILMNKMEDQLISGSSDRQLKLWRKKVGSWVCSQSISMKFKVWNMSLNEMENKLIVCVNNQAIKQTRDKLSCIHVLIYGNNQQWSIVQTIDIPEHGWRLQFTLRDEFVFATENSNQLQIFNYNADKRQFEQVSQSKILNVKLYKLYGSSGFPCQFIKSLNFLIYKHDEWLNIIQVDEKGNYKLIQAIEFGVTWIQGIVTNDGQYLVVWDSKSKQIQVRQINQLE